MAEVGKMCLSGRIKVRKMRFRELQAFAGCFDFSSFKWMEFYLLRHDDVQLVDMFVKMKGGNTVLGLFVCVCLW